MSSFKFGTIEVAYKDFSQARTGNGHIYNRCKQDGAF